MTTAREIMHMGAECISEDDTLQAAAQKMRDLDVGALPICGQDDRLHGIITDRDIVVACIAEGRNPAEVKARDCAQGSVRWVDSTTDVDEVLNKMQEYQIKRMPVLENHRLVGMISEADVGRHLSDDQVAHFVESVYGRGREPSSRARAGTETGTRPGAE
ncbi:MAG TPA: CBS domain-containing protein [Micromonosporaceae bacterium]